MKYLVSLISLALAPAAFAANPTHDIQGVVHNVTIGEIDPSVVGDACLVEVKQKDGQIFGLLTDYDECTDFDMADPANIGRGVVVAKEVVEFIEDKEELDVLKSFDPKPIYLRTEFGHIENGLADEP